MEPRDSSPRVTPTQRRLWQLLSCPCPPALAPPHREAGRQQQGADPSPRLGNQGWGSPILRIGDLIPRIMCCVLMRFALAQFFESRRTSKRHSLKRALGLPYPKFLPTGVPQCSRHSPHAFASGEPGATETMSSLCLFLRQTASRPDTASTAKVLPDRC